MKDYAKALENLFEIKGIGFRPNRKSFILNHCPRCSGQKCYVRRKDGRSICFSGKCGAKWSCYSLIAELLNVDTSEAPKLLFGVDSSLDYKDIKLDFDDLVVDFKDEFDFENDADGEELQKPIILGPDFLPVEKSDVGVNYLIERKIIDPLLIAAYDIKYHALMNAIVFPVIYNGEIYGWQARSIPPLKEGQLRLITSPGLNKSKFLLNYDRAKIEKNIIVTEGPVDCIHADIDGYGAVCTFGKSVSPNQIKLIIETKAEAVYLGLDRDAAKEVEYLCKKICPHKKVYRIHAPDHRKDLGECTFEEMLQAIENAQLCESYISSRLEIYIKN